MSESSDRLDRVDRILERTGARLDAMSERVDLFFQGLEETKKIETAASQRFHDEVIGGFDAHMLLMRESQERFDAKLLSISERLDLFFQGLEETKKIVHETAARQQFHDEANDRFDAHIRSMKESQEWFEVKLRATLEIGASNTARIGALLEIVEHHQRRLGGLEGGQAA